MRKLVIAIGIVLVLIVGVVVLAIVNLNAFLEQNRERLAKLASDAAGREVHYEQAKATLSRGLAVRIDGLRVSEDPRFGDGDFLRLESGYVDVDLWPALQGRVEVRGVRLDGPIIQVIQNARGFNFDSLGSGETAPASPAPEGEGGSTALAIAALEIGHGTVVYADRRSKDGLALTIESFESSGTDLSLEGPIAIDFSGRVRPTSGNAALASRLSGRLTLDTLDPVAGRLELASPTFFPALLGVVLEEEAEPEHLDDLSLVLGLPADSAKSGMPVELRAARARLGGFDLSDVDLTLRLVGERLAIEQAKVGLAGGQVDVAGYLTLGGSPGRSPFDLRIGLERLDSGVLAPALLGTPPGVISGALSGRVDVQGRSLEWESLKKTLAGNVRLHLAEGALEKVNVLDALVGRLVADPGVGALIASSLRDVAPAALEGGRTPFKGADLAVQIVDGALRADALGLEAGDFVLSGEGTVGLDGALSGAGTLRLSEALSKKLVAKADRLAPLLGGGERVELPLRFGGGVASPSLRPDLTALTARAREQATTKLKEKAVDELTDAIFGKRKKSDPEASEAETEEATPRDARDEARDLLDKGLKGILGR